MPKQIFTEIQSKKLKKLGILNSLDLLLHIPLRYVDETKVDLIKDIRPDILFKGSDYKNKKIVGSKFLKENGGKVELIDILTGYSTTNIIKNSSI